MTIEDIEVGNILKFGFDWAYIEWDSAIRKLQNLINIVRTVSPKPVYLLYIFNFFI